MTRKKSILIIEDEPAIRDGLTDVLVYHGYEVATADNGETGLASALSSDHDLVLLDIMLPKLDGFSVCDALRKRKPDQSVIMLTARTSDDDIVQGLRLGADDYVAKPFSVEQLVLRIAAVLRRGITVPENFGTLHLTDKTIDTENLVCSNGTAFTRREMDVLLYLQRNAGRPVPREELLHRVWGYRPDAQIETRTADIHIAKLRKKVEVDPKNPTHIITVRGAGYRLDGVQVT